MRSFCLYLLLICACASALAQESGVELINSGNIEEYRAVLPQGLEEALREHSLELKVSKKINYSFIREDISEDISGSHLLSAMQNNLQGLKQIDFSFNLSNFAQGTKKVWGSFIRQYGEVLPLPQSENLFFREKISFNVPKKTEEFQYLTFRLSPVEGNSIEDYFWIASPVTGKVREVSEANRSDALAGSSFNLEDFLTWSARVDSVEVVNVKAGEFFAGFYQTDPLLLTSQENSCASVDLDSAQVFKNNPEKTSAKTLFNGSQVKFADDLDDWVFVKRAAWEVEIKVNNAFVMYPRQIIYIDKESLLPFYKASFDQLGNLDKVTISAFGLAKNDKQQKIFYAGSKIFSKTKKTSIIEIGKFRICDQIPQDLAEENFDPAALLPKPVQEVQEKKPEVKVEEVDE